VSTAERPSRGEVSAKCGKNQDCHSRKKPPLVPLPCIWVAKFGRGRAGTARPEHIRRHYFSPSSLTKVFHLSPKSTAFYTRSSQGISFMFACINFRFANLAGVARQPGESCGGTQGSVSFTSRVSLKG